jgi:hypothetical protein
MRYRLLPASLLLLQTLSFLHMQAGTRSDTTISYPRLPIAYPQSSLSQQPQPSRDRSVFRTVRADSTATGQFGLFQLTIDLAPVYSNPYDYDDIAVRCVFTGPQHQRDTVDGFYMQDFTLDTASGQLTPASTGSFKVRYSPRLPGTWSYSLFCITKEGEKTGGKGTFTCYPTSSPGFVRRNPSPYLAFDNGAPYIPIGENMGWAHSNTYRDYSRWVDRLAQNKGNFIRVWMPSWGLGLEWLKGRNGYGGLQQYKQQNAWYLDWLIDFCQQKGVYLMLSLDHHGQVSSKVDPNWNENPYNAANGGPCVNTWDFFTDQHSRHLIRNRFRYIVARYGYSRNILCWELFNEVDWTDDFAHHKTDVTAWHEEMAAWLSRLDVNRHLITTSYGMAANDPFSWKLPGLDFTQTHYYTDRPLDSVLSSGAIAYRTSYGKPTLNGEFGLSSDAKTLSSADPTGIYVHNSLWASLLSGAMGTALPWYWDNYIDPQNLYVHFDAIAKFAADIKFIKDGYKPITAQAAALRVYVLSSKDSTSLAGWLLNKNYNWQDVRYKGAPSPVTGSILVVPGIKDGKYMVTWSDCHTGLTTATGTVMVKDQVLRLACPDIKWDLALRIKRS